jgi:hypothetical protein
MPRTWTKAQKLEQSRRATKMHAARRKAATRNTSNPPSKAKAYKNATKALRALFHA